MKIKDLLKISLIDVKNRKKTTLKLFILFLIVVFFASSFIIYISSLDDAANKLLNEERINKQLIIRNKVPYLPIEENINHFNNKHIRDIQEKYFTIIWEYKVNIKIDGTDFQAICSQLDYSTQQHNLGHEKRKLNKDEIIVGSGFLESIGLKDLDKYIGKTLTLTIAGNEIFSKRIAGIEDNTIITLSVDAVDEIKQNLIVINWFFVEVDDYKNKQEVVNYFSEMDFDVTSVVDNEENLKAINSHRQLMTDIFIVIGIVVFLAMVICVVFTIIIDDYSKSKYKGTILANGMTNKDLSFVTFFSLLIIYSLAFLIGYLISIGMMFSMIGLLESIFSIEFSITFAISQIALFAVYFGGILVVGICTFIVNKVNKNKSITTLIKEI